MDTSNPFQVLEDRLINLQNSLDFLIQQGAQGVPVNDPRLIDRKELAKRLGLSELTLIRYAARGIIKEIRIGSAVRFRYDDVLQTLEKRKSSKHVAAAN